jgi:hypothetical protein
VSGVGRSPYTPHAVAGSRIEPARSEPKSSWVSPAASAAADPPEDPAGDRARSHGLFVAPNSSLSVCPKSASIGATLVTPTTIAPAARSRATTVASRSATNPGTAPHVTGSPATWSASLTVTGTPCSGPSGSAAASAAAAAASAPSRSTPTMALTRGLTLSIRASSASTRMRADVTSVAPAAR